MCGKESSCNSSIATFVLVLMSLLLSSSFTLRIKLFHPCCCCCLRLLSGEKPFHTNCAAQKQHSLCRYCHDADKGLHASFFPHSDFFCFSLPFCFVYLRVAICDVIQGLPDRQTWNKITGMAHNKTKSKKKNELEYQVSQHHSEEWSRKCDLSV